MNIYIHVEVAARELDGNLLLATIAASKGHNVLVSEIEVIINGTQHGALSPGVFHTKSLAPSEKKIILHQKLTDKGMSITSIDQEAGLTIHGYKDDVIRFSEKTIEQSSAIFCWGDDDSKALNRIYSHHTSKIHMTGSPRADLWGKRLLGYWRFSDLAPQKPYLLISSNMGVANHHIPLHERISSERIAGYHQRDPKRFADVFGWIAEDYKMTIAFIEAIRYLASFANNYEIVFRPHPAENIEAWKIYLEGIPNVHVIREGSITAWVNHAFAVMHNGCTTAIEATISDKPVITYIPFDQEYAREIPNELGHRVKTLKSLSRVVNELFERTLSKRQRNRSPLVGSIAKKVHIDDFELAAEKIVKIWESLDCQEPFYPPKILHLRILALLSKFKLIVRTFLGNTLPRKFNPIKDNYKFPPMDATDISDRVCRLQKVLGLNEPLECILISDQTVLIRKKS